MALTNKQVTILNRISRYWDFNRTFKFGDILHTLSGGANEGTPVNAANASGLLTLTGVVKHGDLVSVYNPENEEGDVYEFLACVEEELSDGATAPVFILNNTVKASVNLTMVAQASPGDTMTIGNKVYTFRLAGDVDTDGEIGLVSGLAASQEMLVEAINGTDGINEPHPLVTAGDFVENVCTITAIYGGTAGNSISSVETFSNVGNVFASDTLLNGADCSAANAVTALVSAINDLDTQGVTAAPGTGTKVALTADVPGVLGNDIETEATMANGSFGAAKMSGGVDGTVGSVRDIYVDSSWAYFCVAPNTITGKNWRRVSLGSAF